MNPRRHVSAAVPLALLWAALIAYASLYPFTPWHAGGVDAASLLRLPFTRLGVGSFDIASNVAGYLPLGALLLIAAVRHGVPPANAVLRTIAIAAALSYAMEVLQHFVADRVASSLDVLLNVAGAASGALLAWCLVRLGVVGRWLALRERWFVVGSAGVIVLLLLWPIGLLFPPPLPFGVGSVFERAREAATTLLEGTAWQPAPAEPRPAAMSGAAETIAVALGLLAPALLAYTIAQPGWRRLPLLAGAALLGFGVTTISTALNFGPEHALAWIGPAVLPAIALALVAGTALAWLPRRAAAAAALLAIVALLALVERAPTDPYYASSLQAWQQGQFIRFHGLAQWVGWLWPYAAIALLLARLVRRQP